MSELITMSRAAECGYFFKGQKLIVGDEARYVVEIRHRECRVTVTNHGGWRGWIELKARQFGDWMSQDLDPMEYM